MEARIHATAVVDPDAEIDPTAQVGPFAVIGPRVVLGANVHVGAHTVVGTCAENAGVDPRTSKPGIVIIGRDTIIREHVTIHGASDCGRTLIGPRCHIQAHAHIGHDATLEDDVTVACYACVGGHATVGRHANLGLHSVLHQRSEFPAGSMLGMNSSFKGKGTPYTTYVGNLAKAIGANWRLVDKQLSWMAGQD